jgi:hypothetical protein
MIYFDATKYPTKAAVISTFKRLAPPLKASTQVTARQPEADAASEFDAGKGGAELAPQSAAGGDGAPSPKDVDVPDTDCVAERAGDFSPGENDPDLRNSETPSVATYVSAINGEWQRGVDAFINAARLCAEANARLTIAQKSVLIQGLPFGETAFSKFVQIGSDARLPEIQRLLPPHYTTVYAVTLLTDEELKRAIAENVIYPDMKRAELQKWHRELSRKAEHASKPKEAASDSAVVGLLIAPTKDAVESGALPSTRGNDNRDDRELSVAPEDPPAPEAVATAAETKGPLTPPPGDDDIPAFLDRRPLSLEDQRAFDAIMAALNAASPVVRERVRAELVRANAWSGSVAKAVSGRRQEDDASAIRNQPTESVVPAYTADAAERTEGQKAEPAEEAPLGVTPDALEQVRPKRRPRKARGFQDDAPF